MLKLLFSYYTQQLGTMEGTGCTCESSNFNFGIANLLAFYSFFKGNIRS